MASSWWSDAADALASNVLPFFQASQVKAAAKDDSKAQVAIAQAQAQSVAATEASRAKVYAAMAISGVAAVALIVLLRMRR